MIRRANKEDIEELNQLMHCCFGDRKDATSYKTKTEQYLVYIIDNKIIGMTGLVWSSDYKAFEIAWTCTHPDYRNKHIMHKLFQALLENIDEKVYCSCWHLENNKYINLYKLMKDFEFKQILSTRVAYKRGHNCHYDEQTCKGCNGLNCSCIEELYLRKG